MKQFCAFIILLAAFCGCTGGGQYNEMLQRLDALNKLNRADSVLTVTERDEAQTLTDYFDSHGTPNDQLLAYYLLGRCYADMREAPMALHCYQEAITRADTLSPDCDFAQLSRVYGQSATIFYQQGLYQNSLDYSDFSVEYGYRGKDTLNALRSYAMKGAAYDKLQAKDSAIHIYTDAIKQMKTYKFSKMAAGFSGTLAKKLIDKGETMQAIPYMQDYEQNSGFYDSVGNVESKREMYYCAKGLFFLNNKQLDSAEYYFRKELHDGRDYGNQNSGSHRLAQLFMQKHMPDSAAKYALYAYDMNDSVYSQKSMHEIEQAKAMYDYTRQQELAKLKEIEANKERAQKERIIYASLALLLLLGFIYFRWNHKKKEYQALLATHQQAEAELQSLRRLQTEHQQVLADVEKYHKTESVLNSLVQKKEEEVEKLRLAIKKNKWEEKHNSRANALAISQMKQADAYQTIITKINRGNTLTSDDWQSIDNLLMEHFPGFLHFLESKRNQISYNKYCICLLTRLDVNPQRISVVLGIQPSYVTKAREQMLTQFFGIDGTAKEFDQKLKSL
ncbi:MAG: hypothetical protein K6G32_07040 [Prevotella sp.]|nr:hypothetical protein [Prevotella sp.]